MWSVGSRIADVYVGDATACTLAPINAAVENPCWIPASSATDSWASSLAWLERANDRGRRTNAIRVWLSGSLARPFIFGPMEGIRHRGEALDVARSVAPTATGMEAPCLIWMDQWKPGASVLAIAVSQGLRDTIERSGREARMRIASIRPWWTGALDDSSRAQAGLDVLSVEDTDSLTLLAGDHRTFSAATTYSPAPVGDAQEAILARRSLDLDLDRKAVRRARFDSERRSASDAPPFLRWISDEDTVGGLQD